MNDVVLNSSSPLQAEVVWDGVVATVTVTGELDLTTATHLTRCFLAVAARRPERLVLDLSGLVFADVAGARALHEVPTLLPTGCPVIVRQPPPPSARKVFEITGLMGGLAGPAALSRIPGVAGG